MSKKRVLIKLFINRGLVFISIEKQHVSIHRKEYAGDNAICRLQNVGYM